MSTTNRILFLYAHMDDETILSYGTISKFAEMDNCVLHLGCLCGKGRLNSDQKKRKTCFDGIVQTKFKDNAIVGEFNDLTLTKQIVDSFVNKTISTIKPTFVITHSMKDLHFEHRLIAESVLLNSRSINGSTVKKLWTTMSPTEFLSHSQFGNYNPNVFVDIANYIVDKQHMLQMYECELPKDENDIRSSESILLNDKLNGHSICKAAAESYEQIFGIE